MSEKKQLRILLGVLGKMGVKTKKIEDLETAKTKFEEAISEGEAPEGLEGLTSDEIEGLKTLGYEIKEEKPKGKKTSDEDKEDEEDEDEDKEDEEDEEDEDKEDEEDEEDEDKEDEEDEDEDEDEDEEEEKPKGKKKMAKDDDDDDDDEEEEVTTKTKEAPTKAKAKAKAKDTEEHEKVGGKKVKKWMQEYFKGKKQVPYGEFLAAFNTQFADAGEHAVHGYLWRAKKGKILDGKILVSERILRVTVKVEEDEEEDEDDAEVEEVKEKPVKASKKPKKSKTDEEE